MSCRMELHCGQVQLAHEAFVVVTVNSWLERLFGVSQYEVCAVDKTNNRLQQP